MTNLVVCGILSVVMATSEISHLEDLMRILMVKPEAFMHWLERAHEGETPEDLMFEALDIAMETVVNMEVEEDE